MKYSFLEYLNLYNIKTYKYLYACVNNVRYKHFLKQVSQQPSLSSLETLMVSQKSEIEYLQKKLKMANEKLSENRSTNKGSSEKSILTSTEGKRKVGTVVIL